MATSSTTSTVYIHVIEDVINKVRDEFINNGGPGEGVLSELQAVCAILALPFSLSSSVIFCYPFINFVFVLGVWRFLF